MHICMENFLPEEIKLDIFSRLPVETVLQCRQVCKTWRTLLHNPCFAHMHLHRSQQLDDGSYNNHSTDFVSTKVGFLMFISLKDERYRNNPLHYQEYDENEERERSYKPLTRINHPLIGKKFIIVGSCNGLICFFTFDDDDDIYIVNPITRDYVILDNVTRDGCPRRCNMSGFGCNMCGFGYVSSTNEYKVVRLYFHYESPHDSQQMECDEVYAQVYTLGSGSGWRKIKCSLSLQGHWWSQCSGVFANGALHWMDFVGNVMYFDLADEELRWLPLLPFDAGVNQDINLNVLRGRLCVVYVNPDYALEVWSYKNNESSTTNETNVLEYQSWCWSKEFSVPAIFEDGYYINQLFAFTPSGEVLFIFSPKRPDEVYLVACYDPKTKTLTRLVLDFRSYSRGIPHVNSFVSLKSFGEDAKIIEPAEKILTRREVAT